MATWPEVLTHNITVEMIKLAPDRFQNQEVFKSCLLLQRVKGGISCKNPRPIDYSTGDMTQACTVVQCAL